MSAGRKRDLIGIERASVSQDAYGEEVSTWGEIGVAWAEVIYGNGVEQRQAAMEGGELPATFLVWDNPFTREIGLKDRISFDEGVWDITANKPANRPGDRAITATRAL